MAITTRDVITKPTVPTLGPAPYLFNEPSFGGTPILRATDRLTGFAFTGQVDHSWSPPSAVSQRAWASDSSHFYGMNRNGVVLIFDFNPSTRVRTERELLAGGFYGGEPSFSRTNPNYLYLAAGNSHKLLKRADLSTAPATYTTVFDAEVLIPALSVGDTYMRGGFTCDNDVIVCSAGGSNQDLTQFVIWYPLNSPSSVKILNTRTRAEMFKSYGVGPTLHAAQPDTSGRYALLRVADAQELDGNIHRSDWGYIWDTTLDTITEVTNGPDGHYALGYGYMINQGIIPGHSYDARQWVLRNLATPNTGLSELVSSVITPQSVLSEDHTAWCNAHASVPFVPVISVTFRDWDGPHAVQNSPTSFKNTEAWGTYDEEVLTLATDGSGLITRFGHHRCRTWPEPVGDWLKNTYFYGQPLFNVSPDGRNVMVNSNMEHTLGFAAYDTNSSGIVDPNIHRTDIFIWDLAAGNDPRVRPPFRGRRQIR